MTVDRCADVTYDMADSHCGEPLDNLARGDLLWNPKGGDGHVLVREGKCGTDGVDCGCGGYPSWRTCDAIVLICECGEDNSWRDHHYWVLARASSYPTTHHERTAMSEGPTIHAAAQDATFEAILADERLAYDVAAEERIALLRRQLQYVYVRGVADGYRQGLASVSAGGPTTNPKP